MADTTSADTAADPAYLTAAEVSKMINIPVSTVQDPVPPTAMLPFRRRRIDLS